jgi:prevent-host-death family protein
VPQTRSRTASDSEDGSSSATLVCVSHIAQKELRNHVGEVLRRAEAGETLTVTVACRPVAELGPAHRRRWVSGATLAGIWRAKAPRGLDADLERLPAGVVDPFAS